MSAATLATHTSTRPSEAADWFASWFDSPHYHRLYAHRDVAEASRFLDRLIESGYLTAGAHVLDLGCGAGRHSRYLASKGFDVTGLDLSEESLNKARLNAGENVRFVRQDMRLPFHGRFGHVLNLFTSFGYFADPADNLSVLHNIAGVLEPDGTLVLDYLNVRYAERHLKGDEVIERDSTTFRISRWSDECAIFKRILIEDGPAPAHELVERVAKLTLADFRFTFGLCGLTLETTFGDYELGPYDENVSPRLVLIARRAAPAAGRTLTPREVPAYAADGFRRHAQV